MIKRVRHGGNCQDDMNQLQKKILKSNDQFIAMFSRSQLFNQNNMTSKIVTPNLSPNITPRNIVKNKVEQVKTIVSLLQTMENPQLSFASEQSSRCHYNIAKYEIDTRDSSSVRNAQKSLKKNNLLERMELDIRKREVKKMEGSKAKALQQQQQIRKLQEIRGKKARIIRQKSAKMLRVAVGTHRI